MTSSRFNQPWVNRKVKRLSRQKQRTYNQARSCRNPQKKARTWVKYNNLKKRMQKACNDAYDTYINNIICADLKSNPKRFWSHISSNRSDNNGVAPLRGSSGATYTGSRDKANLLNNQFCSVFNKAEEPNSLPDLGPSPFPPIPPTEVSVNGVIKLLKKLNPHKATGPDSIPARLLKELADCLGPVLAILYQASINTGMVPDIWKSAIVTPIFKKGDRNKPSNYRPISLTVICCKLLEHIIHSSVMRHFLAHDVLSDVQHGFRKARSCESQLIITVDDIAQNLDNGQQTDLILLDFSKAFDKVPHHHLLHKLKFYGIHGSLITWISSFLQGRVQRVVLDGESSEVSPVSSGVPQGTVLGPLLFLAYINDLPNCISEGSRVRLFADDCIVYRVINNTDDASYLQHDLDALQEWEQKWMMEFHPDKFKVLHITRRRNPIISPYSIHNDPLDAVPSAKYLGVELTDKLSWNKHIDSTTKKGIRTLGFLRRNLRKCPQDIKATCYKVLVRPILEYASCVWDPNTKMNVAKVESVQRHAARYVKNNFSWESSVTTMLKDLKWDTLQHRRSMAKVTMMYRIHNKFIDIPSDRLIPIQSPTRGHNQRFAIPKTRTSLLRGTFFPDTIRLWNSLSQETINATSPDIFRDRLKDVTLGN